MLLSGRAPSSTPTATWDATLTADLAVWRAATGVADDDWRQTGEPQLPAAEAHAQRRLNQRIARVLGDPNAATSTWSPLANSIDPRITTDPYWPILATQLAAAHRAGIDITALTHAVAASQPLPDEQPAAALWWRLASHLSPAATIATGNSVNDTLRPDWTPDLARVLGEQTAARITADPAWPGLVAAVTGGTAAGWQPDQLLDAAYDLLRGGQPEDTELRPGELATALTWRVSMLTDPDPVAVTIGATAVSTRAPAMAGSGNSGADIIAHGLGDVAAAWPDAAPVLDAAWLASLPEPDPTPDDDMAPPPHGAGADSEPPNDLHAAHTNDRGDANPDDDAGVIWVADGGETPTSRGALYEYPASAAVPRERIVALNQTAANFYATAYPDSWASGYVTTRLGDQTTTAPGTVGSDGAIASSLTLASFGLGYAPDSWTALTDHLHAAGATDTELTAAGLASYASTGRLIDRFRDRLVFPITATGPNGDTEIHGFIARRNPTHDPVDTADSTHNHGDNRHGPKYLNTAETDLFRKGREMFGAAETRDLLTAGATPVLVEGPMDAIAVSLAGQGRYAGLAPMGTALTDGQADKLLAHHSEPPRVIVATDADHPGLQAAHRAYWQLVLRGDNPRRLTIHDGKDPRRSRGTAWPPRVARRARRRAVAGRRAGRRGHRGPRRPVRHRRRPPRRHPPLGRDPRRPAAGSVGRAPVASRPTHRRSSRHRHQRNLRSPRRLAHPPCRRRRPPVRTAPARAGHPDRVRPLGAAGRSHQRPPHRRPVLACPGQHDRPRRGDRIRRPRRAARSRRAPPLADRPSGPLPGVPPARRTPRRARPEPKQTHARRDSCRGEAGSRTPRGLRPAAKPHAASVDDATRRTHPDSGAHACPVPGAGAPPPPIGAPRAEFALNGGTVDAALGDDAIIAVAIRSVGRSVTPTTIIR